MQVLSFGFLLSLTDFVCLGKDDVKFLCQVKHKLFILLCNNMTKSFQRKEEKLKKSFEKMQSLQDWLKPVSRLLQRLALIGIIQLLWLLRLL